MGHRSHASRKEGITMKTLKSTAAVLLALAMVLALAPVFAVTEQPERGVNSNVVIDDDAAGGYEGDYVVIYNPSTSSSTSYSTGTLTGLIETSVGTGSKAPEGDKDVPEFYRVDADGIIAERERAENSRYGYIETSGGTRASYNVGDTKSFTISSYNPGSGSTLTFKVVAKGEHCYIWTPSQNVTNYYTLDSIDPTYPQLAANEFDRMYSLMNSSFGNHNNGSNGDGRVSLLFYNIDDGWNGSGGFVAGYFSSSSYSYDGMPIINIDTYPGVYYKTSSGAEGKSMDIAYSTACHEYQHCINYSNTSSMNTWLNECFSAAAEEICYPGSSVVSRIMSWEDYTFSTNNDWLDPPEEHEYNSSLNLHKGYSLYTWSNSLEMDDTLALYAQVSFFAQYLFTRFGNSIYLNISNKFKSASGSNREPTAITNATGVNCADLAGDFRIAVTANASDGYYGFYPQEGYDPSMYHDVQNPYDLLSPVVFTGSSCSIKGGGAITVKPVNGVFNPPSGASTSLKYYGITVNKFTVSAVSDNEEHGTVSVNGNTITAYPAAGYYVSGYEVIEGSASVTVSGNTLSVKPESDCTILVIFSPKPLCTVSFYAAGSAEGSQTAYIYDSITLPSSVSASAEGWTFCGWTDSSIEDETTDKPAFYDPGASYTVTGDAVLNALYTRTEGSDETAYELLTAAPSDWAGNYVITCGTNTSMYVLKGLSGNTSYQSNTSGGTVTFANTGMTLDGSYLKNAGDVYVFTAASAGSGHSLQNVSTGTYLGSNYNRLYSISSYSQSSCVWTLDYDSSNACMKVKLASNYSSYYLAMGSGSYFSLNSSYTTNKTQFWKETNLSTTYYTTMPVAPPSDLPGDVDCDGFVTFTDASLFAGYLLNLENGISEQGMINADANLDTNKDLLDLAAICDIALGRQQ